MSSSPTRVALALGSGAARGYAHIGVIAELEARGFEIVAVAGASMGALVGGMHAAGALEEYTEWALSLKQFDVLRMLDPALGSPGAIRAGKVFSRVSEMLAGVNIERLGIPFTAVATDLGAGREVWFQEGPLDEAIRASIAIPGVITPVMHNGRLLSDGGLLNPVPIAPLAAAGADLTVAVSLGGERKGFGGTPERETSVARRFAGGLLERESVRGLMARFERDRDRLDDDGDELPPGLRRSEVLTYSLELMQGALTRYRLAGYPPDVMVTISRDAARSLDFHRARPLIDLGRVATAEALDRRDGD